jgi:hypothetical protein
MLKIKQMTNTHIMYKIHIEKQEDDKTHTQKIML